MNRQVRKKLVFAEFIKSGEMSARQCANHLGFIERNAAHPRINELEKAGLLVRTGKYPCELTHENVTHYKVNPDIINNPNMINEVF